MNSKLLLSVRGTSGANRRDVKYFDLMPELMVEDTKLDYKISALSFLRQLNDLVLMSEAKKKR